MKRTKTFIIVAAGLVALTALTAFSFCIINSKPKTPTMKTVPNVDLARYLGKWYEIGRFPHSFEKNLQAVTATYTMRDDGKISVLNEGDKFQPGGKHKIAKGKARIPDTNIPGYLQVSFFLCFYADYYILELDTVNYQYSLVGSSTPNYLWILSRSPEMSNEVYSMLVEKAKQLGYDISKIEKVQHEPKI